jgi:hypothetical protein
MATYVYGAQQQTFGTRDTLAPDNPEKIVRGAQLDLEFSAITSGKLDVSGTNFDGTISNGTVDGGLY